MAWVFKYALSLTDTRLLQRIFWARLHTVSRGVLQPLLWQGQREFLPLLGVRRVDSFLSCHCQNRPVSVGSLFPLTF